MSYEPTDDGFEKQQRCSICRDVSPITHTNYTLISPKHKWRMELRSDPDGHRIPVWYCPECWARVKQTRNSSKPVPAR